jgi:hypothetical protein
MKLIFTTLLLCGLQVMWAQQPILGLARTTNPPSVRLATLDPSTGVLSPLSSGSVSNSINLTGAAYDFYLQRYYFIGDGGLVGVDANTGVSLGSVALTNPLAPSYFDNFRFNPSDSLLYGLARRNVTNPQTGLTQGEMFLATIDPLTGVISQISSTSIGQSYALSGSAIDPQLMLYYYTDGSHLQALDLYNGTIFSSSTFSFPNGGQYFDNFTYNCADATMYGLIRNTTSTTMTFGKVDPATGVVTQIGSSPLNVYGFTVNGSSTIDPTTGTYYFVSTMGGVTIYGISLQTGQITQTISVTNPAGSSPLYFDMMRSPSDCFDAAAVRLNPALSVADSKDPQTLQIVPNPFEQHLQIAAQQAILSLQLLNANGQKIFSWTATEPSNQASIELPALPSGVYFATIQTPSGILQQKLVK